MASRNQPPSTSSSATPSSSSTPSTSGAAAAPSSSRGGPSGSVSGAASRPSPTAQPQSAISDWCQAILDFYPNFLTQTYFLPPLHFNRVPYVEAALPDLSAQPSDPSQLPQDRPVTIPDPCQPGPSKRPRLEQPLYSAPPSASTHLQGSDVRSDACLEMLRHCLRVLADSQQEVMMVVCELDFRKYLDGETDPIHRAQCALFPRPADLRAQKQHEGDFDILIVHRTCGLVTMEVKAVGAEPSMVPTDQVVVKKVTQAVKQLEKAKDVLHHLVHDLTPTPIRVTRCLMVPYLTSQQLSQALTTAPVVAQDLVQCVGGQDVQDAISRCLCADQVPATATLRGGSVTSQLTGWWQAAVQGAGPDPQMSDHIYQQLLARFAGPATTVEVATPSPPQRVVRTEGEAVAETGLRVSSLALTPQQVTVLSRPDPCVYLRAPPGCGKTLLLLLKARQWLGQGHHVHVVSLSDRARAVSSLICAQLGQSQGAAAAVTYHTFNIFGNPGELNRAITTLAALSHNGLHVIVDELDEITRYEFPKFCRRLQTAVGLHIWLQTTVHRRLQTAVPSLSLWAAGLWGLDSPPDWLTVEDSLTIPMRCPPTVQQQVEQSAHIGDDVPSYSPAPWPAPTQGPPVQWMQHHHQPGHSEGHPLDCEQCGRDIGQRLRALGVGQPGQPLQWRDVFLLYGPVPPPTAGLLRLANPSSTADLVRGLQSHSIPVGVLTPNPTQPDLDQVARGLQNQVTVAMYECVQGLERRVIVGLGSGLNRLSIMSRCTSLLIWVDEAYRL